MPSPDLDRPNPYRDADAGPPPERRRVDATGVLFFVLAAALAALPFVQLALTGAASQTDLGISVTFLFVLITLTR